jgi:hypothetical protein
VAQEAKSLPSKHKALSLNSSNTHTHTHTHTYIHNGWKRAERLIVDSYPDFSEQIKIFEPQEIYFLSVSPKRNYAFAQPQVEIVTLDTNPRIFSLGTAVV